MLTPRVSQDDTVVVIFKRTLLVYKLGPGSGRKLLGPGSATDRSPSPSLD